MKKCKLKLLLIYLVILAVVNGQKWNSGKSVSGRKVSKNGGGYLLDEGNGKTATQTNAPTKNQPVRKGGIGAWGYVSIALFVILSGIGVYYTIIFYPIVCKKQRMYQVMGSTTV